MPSRAQYFSIALVFLLVIAVFTALTPAMVNVDLFYPKRADSLLLAQEIQLASTASGIQPDPTAVSLAFEPFDVRTADSLLLRGWYVRSAKTDAPTLLVVHDLNEGKINYLEMFRQLHDRELHVCVTDLRAHGTSEGKEFTPGMVSVSDVRAMLDSLFLKEETQSVCILGVGIGAFVAAQAAVLDDRISGLLLENAFLSYRGYLDHYAEQKWGRLQFLFHTAFLQKAQHQIQMDPAELNMARLLTYIDKPTLFLAGGVKGFAAASESAILKDSSAARQKELFLIPGSSHSQMAESGDEYYNRIAEFVVRTLPPKQKKSRYKRLALL